MYSKKVDEYDPTSRRVIRCAFEGGKVLYEKASCAELAEQQIPFEQQKEWIVRSRIFSAHSRSFAAKKKISSQPHGGHSLCY